MSSGVTILHTADLHLGELGWSDVRWAGFAAVLDRAQRADALLITGDLFDHARVSDELLHAVGQAFGRLSCPVVVVPGNHDLAGPHSVLARMPVAADDVQVILRPAGATVAVPGTQLTVWARGMTEHSPANRPLAGHRAPGDGRWHIVAAHGHVVDRCQKESLSRSSPIERDEIDQLQCDYVALGHWHRRTQIITARVRAGYSGSPTPESDRAAGSADLIRISGQGAVRVTPVLLHE